MTIIEAIKQVMRAHGAPMTSNEAYRAIVASNLYQFRADDPTGIVRNQIRRHCEGLDFASAGRTKHFRLVGDGRYEPLPEQTAAEKGRRRRTQPKGERGAAPKARGPQRNTLNLLQELHREYVLELKLRIPLCANTRETAAVPEIFVEGGERIGNAGCG